MHARSSNPALRGAGFISLLVLAFLLVGSLNAPATVAAEQDDMPKLGIQPADSDDIFFSETIDPGKSKTLTVELDNAGKTDVKILTYAADVYSLINGGFGVNLSDAPATGTTTWLEYATQTMDLPHGEGRQVEFTLKIPKGTAPGEYVTSLVIQNAKAVKGTGSVAVDQILRQAIAVAITVPGDQRPGLEIGAVSYLDNPSIDALQIEVRNTGNVHLKPTGNLRIVDSTGAVVLETEISMDSVYAGTSTMLELGAAVPFANGDYKISVELGDAKQGASASIFDVPFAVATSEVVSPVISIAKLEVDPVRATADAPVQFADVSTSIENPGNRIEGAQILLHVERDGALVEDYPLAANAAIEPGPLEIKQRYLPVNGWQPGTYSFSIWIESIDPTTNQNAILTTSDSPVVIEIS